MWVPEVPPVPTTLLGDWIHKSNFEEKSKTCSIIGLGFVNISLLSFINKIWFKPNKNSEKNSRTPYGFQNPDEKKSPNHKSKWIAKINLWLLKKRIDSLAFRLRVLWKIEDLQHGPYHKCRLSWCLIEFTDLRYRIRLLYNEMPQHNKSGREKKKEDIVKWAWVRVLPVMSFMGLMWCARAGWILAQSPRPRRSFRPFFSSPACLPRTPPAGQYITFWWRKKVPNKQRLTNSVKSAYRQAYGTCFWSLENYYFVAP